MKTCLQIDQINEHWVSVIHVDQDEIAFDLPLSLFTSSGVQPKEGEVYMLTLTQDSDTQHALEVKTQRQINRLVADDDGDDFSL